MDLAAWVSPAVLVGGADSGIGRDGVVCVSQTCSDAAAVMSGYRVNVKRNRSGTYYAQLESPSYEVYMPAARESPITSILRLASGSLTSLWPAATWMLSICTP